MPAPCAGTTRGFSHTRNLSEARGADVELALQRGSTAASEQYRFGFPRRRAAKIAYAAHYADCDWS
jgi:hypothetical protein